MRYEDECAEIERNEFNRGSGADSFTQMSICHGHPRFPLPHLINFKGALLLFFCLGCRVGGFFFFFGSFFRRIWLRLFGFWMIGLRGR